MKGKSSSRINLTQNPQICRRGKGSLYPVISKHPCETFEFNAESRETPLVSKFYARLLIPSGFNRVPVERKSTGGKVY